MYNAKRADTERMLRENPRLANGDVADMLPNEYNATAKYVAHVRHQIKASLGTSAPAPRRQRRRAANVVAMPTVAATPAESEAERYARIAKRYAHLERAAHHVTKGAIKSLIVSGAPGLGKSHTVETTFRDAGAEYVSIKGSVSAAGLYTMLYNARDDIVLLDDADSVFADVESLNLLKAVLDTGEERRVSWVKKARWLEDEDIPDSFEFRGAVVFCTNVDFAAEAAKGGKLAPHVAALMDRSFYLDLTTRSAADIVTRIGQVIEQGGLRRLGLSDAESAQVFEFVKTHRDRFASLSVRLAVQVGQLRAIDPTDWKDQALLLKARA